MLNSDVVKKILGTAAERKKVETPIPHFWTSQSVVLEITKDELSQLPLEVPQIQNIFPNRTLKLPPLIEVRNMPTAVQEHKASSWG